MTAALAILWAALAARWAVSTWPRRRIRPVGPATSEAPRAAPGPSKRRRNPIAARRAARATAEAIAAAVPDIVDLFALAVASGLNVRLATIAVATRAPPSPVQRALADACAEVDTGGVRLGDALERLPARLGGEAVRPLTAALVDAERYGTALGPTLQRLGAEARRARQRRAEEVARRLPVKLLFPLVTCILPAFGLLTVAPLIAGGLRALRP